jgi:hypothetical protein
MSLRRGRGGGEGWGQGNRRVVVQHCEFTKLTLHFKVVGGKNLYMERECASKGALAGRHGLCLDLQLLHLLALALVCLGPHSPLL